VRFSLLAGTAALVLSLSWAFAAAATVPRAIPSRHSELIEGRALYEAQVNFDGARENNLGPGFDRGVPLKSKAGAD
jgi:hypothetical protein